MLDDVDLGWQVRGDLKANFLLANCGLAPNLHDFLLLKNWRTAGPPNWRVYSSLERSTEIAIA